jgi:formylglycine-generating enzyme required for sulfatase activity
MTLLFLDANDATRDERAAALSQQTGWHVVSVRRVAEGLAWLTGAKALDLLITEAIPSGDTASGFDLRDAALAKFKNARVLFTTRYDLAGYEAKISGWPVLADTPYSPEKLLNKARAALFIDPPTQMLVGADRSPPPYLQEGTTLGQYQILERLSYENETETYRAIQASVQRPVALVLLRPELLHRPEVVERFKARERLKASLTHPRIAPLYEAGEVSGLLFYTRELPRGRSMEELAVTGDKLSERRLAELLYGVAEAMDFALERGCYHRRLEPRDVFIDAQGQASIVNVFRPADSRTRDPREEVAALLAMVEPLAAEGKARGLITSLAEQPRDWAGLMDALDDVREAMRERSIMRRIEAESGEPGQGGGTMPWWFWLGALVGVGIVFSLGNLAGTATPAVVAAGTVLKEPEMVEIPAGPFRYQKSDRRSLPTFWISRHEITLGQYADFLSALKKSPPGAYDHPSQPKLKTSHTPPKWEDTIAAAKAGATFNGQPISLNTPVTQIDWWDAYAYARWRGMRLPTEEEWEKAARGERGLPYPWGEKPARDKANLGDDYDPSGKKGGKTDGYNLFAPVIRKTSDISPYGIQDMAGNVSEWTASERSGEPWPAHPDFPDLRVPVVRGGHFAQKAGSDVLTARHFAESASEITLARGFRIASDKEPPRPRK